jgi:hypothetical protein
LAVCVCVTVRSSETAAQEKPPGKSEITIKRRTLTSEEEFRTQLRGVLRFQEVGFDQPTLSELYAPLTAAIKGNLPLKPLSSHFGSESLKQVALRDNRPDMVILPWITDNDSALAKEEAKDLQALSFKLRFALRKTSRVADDRPDPDKLRTLFTAKEWTAPAAVPTITQVLQAESAAVRLILVDTLSKIKGKEAGTALAKRAIFDTSFSVRASAVRALAARPADEYTPVLISGFRYPWPAAADHAAEAAVALNRTDLVPGLVKLLKEPDPGLPLKTDQGHAVQEVVRINHLCNCMLCHAPSQETTDLVRGLVPLPGETPPSTYYQAKSGLFVRADLTYLRPDFSVMQPVANPGKWAGNQRYDYLVRTRPLTKTEQATFQKLEKEGKVPESYPQQDAVVYALRELTGRDHGTTYESWSAGLRNTPRGTQETEKP